MSRVAFDDAISRRLSLVSSADDEAFAMMQSLERVILEHQPQSPGEAVAMLDVLIPDVVAGGRSDSRDVLALESIRTMLAALNVWTPNGSA